MLLWRPRGAATWGLPPRPASRGGPAAHLTFSSHMRHMSHVQGEWGADWHLKQKTAPHAHSGST